MSDIKIIFDQSDLHIQENLNPKDLKIIFGYEEIIPITNCPPNYWEEVDGDNVSIDCGCTNSWVDKDGDNVNIEYDCGTNSSCDNLWEDTNDFNCGCEGEEWDSSTGNDFNIDCKPSGGGSNTTDLGSVRSYEGQSGTFLIHGLEIFDSHEGQESKIELDIRQTILSTLNGYEGQYVNSIISANRFVVSNSYHGETLTSNIAYATVASFIIDIYEGQQSSTNITSDSVIEPNVYEGQQSNVSVNTYQSIPLSFNVYEGQTLSSVVNTYKGYIVNAYDGSEINVDVFTPETGRMDYFIYEGQSVELDIGLTHSLSVEYKFGDSSDFNISPSYDWSIDAYEGQYNNVVFYNPTTSKLSVNVLEGHYLRVPAINLDTGFIVDIYEGSEVKTNIEYDPYQGLPTLMYSGETMSFQLNSIHEIYDIPSYDGQYVSATINTYESFRITSNVYDGQRVESKPMFTIILGSANAYDGNILEVSSIDETPNTDMFVGEESIFELSTSSLFESEIYEGQYVDGELKRGEPVSLGSIIAYEGQYVYSDVSLLVSTAFRVSYTFGNEIFFNEWSNSPYHIDLGKRNCCANFDSDIRNIELDHAPHNSTSYDQYGSPCETMTFELSTRRTLDFNVYEGQHALFDPTVNTFEVRVHEGQYAYSRDVVTEMTIDLEDGNLIPEYNDITVELNRPLIPSERKYRRMYSGEYTSFKLGVSYAIDPPLINLGERVEISLIVDPALRINAYFGGGARTELSTNVQFPTKAYEGQQTKITVYEDPHLYYVGEECHFELETKSDYYAEFVDKGCLDNQYQETGEDGQPIPSTFNGTNVEGERFLNFVEGRCF